MAAFLGSVAIRVLGMTWRMKLEGDDIRAREKEAGGAVVLAIWHGEMLPLFWYFRHQPVAPLISTHADGEVIGRIAESLGFRPIRGSSSRGGARALLEAVRVLGKGIDVAFSTDGPRGPRRVSAPGAGVAAAKAGVPVVPLGVCVDRYWQLKSWDRFVIPKPFAHLTIRYAKAIHPMGRKSEDGLAIMPDVDHALMTVCAPDVV